MKGKWKYYNTNGKLIDVKKQKEYTQQLSLNI